MKYLRNPYIVIAICMVLFAVMYNNATNDFMRFFAYVPLVVSIGLLIKAIVQAKR